MKRRLAFVLSLAATLTLWGCAPVQVSRIEPDTQVDLSGYWNDTDSRLTAEAMIQDCLTGSWVTEVAKPGQKPVVIAGSIRNNALEHIATATFLLDITDELVKSGRVRVVASAEERGEVRQERAEQQANASPETLKQMGRELGADAMLLGEINQINDASAGKDLKYYQVNLTLVSIETNEKVWVGTKKIKKFIGRGKFKP